jgi:hypothetical protein
MDTSCPHGLCAIAGSRLPALASTHRYTSRSDVAHATPWLQPCDQGTGSNCAAARADIADTGA